MDPIDVAEAQDRVTLKHRLLRRFCDLSRGFLLGASTETLCRMYHDTQGTRGIYSDTICAILARRGFA